MDTLSKTEAYLERLDNRIALRVSDTDYPGVAEFASLFWSRLQEEDLADRDVEDDAGLCIESWRLFRDRGPDDLQIHIRNPVRARDGWQSRHTIVQLMAPDMPFAVDSLLMALSHGGLVTHLLNNVVFGVKRDKQGGIELLTLERKEHRELLIHAEIDRVAEEDLPALETRLEKMAADLQAVVSDYAPMKERLRVLTEELKTSTVAFDAEGRSEALDFLAWLSKDAFTFLGYREFEYLNDTITQVGDPLGTLRLRSRASERRISEQPESTRRFLLEPALLSFSKSGTKSRVHRPAYPDYVGIKRFNEQGVVVGESGFLGLYTSRVYMEPPSRIPVVRRKIRNVLERSDFDPAGFDGKVLAQVLATYPRDELFQIGEGDLLDTAVAITHFRERRRLRIFFRQENYGLFVNCLVYLPRDLFNTRARTLVEHLLVDAFDAVDSEYDILLSESILVRLQFILRIRPGSQVQVDRAALEARIAELISDWSSEFNVALLEAFGETEGRRLQIDYGNAFPAGYREQHSARSAADDVASVEGLSDEQRLMTRFHRQPEDTEETLRLKVLHLGDPLPLSDMIPKLENMGLRVIGEHAYRVMRASRPPVSIHDFLLSYAGSFDLTAGGALFEEAFVRTWNGEAEDDGFNRLVLGAGFSWRQVGVLRTYARYMKQIRFGFGQEFISQTLDKHRALSRLLLDYFESRFAVDGTSDGSTLESEISAALEQVDVLNEDRMMRRMLELMKATKRTNYYQLDGDRPKPYLSIKLMPAEISAMPKPLPMYEVYVCAPYFEGVHLRGGPIARGGLRWSDRLEDYRTEVLGLVKAQIVKNGVIVPTGAKGGFVLKPTRSGGTPKDVVDCYRQFISGLLDLTDNYVQGALTPPVNVRRFDGDDPYLVVAADKGTATFSDHANEVSGRYGFWLGDAFASGGSNGYDHKKMGITAKGGWVSVQRHFAERGIDVQTDPTTVIGIGDMSGDVFGNGMLLSESIKLVAAFNHLHIFIDPDPDARTAFAERQRLFALPRSNWEDYDKSLISEGGGIFSRALKSVKLTKQMQKLFDIEVDKLAPDEFIHALLKAPVHLIWNGGIGTYVKASTENHADVGDRANDHLRVDACELRANAFGEGGNLGMTQKARIEFSLAGGAVNTDFIDNSAGVDCSDHEVNIKIALNELVARQDMTLKQRNTLLGSMTDEVAELVLTNNRNQARTLSLASRHSQHRASEYQRFISRMEADSGLDRALENLPADDELVERVGLGRGLTRPELAVLLAYSKIYLKNSLRAAQVQNDPAIAKEALKAFPETLIAKHEQAILDHPLLPEIVASQLANSIVDNMGITFTVHLMEYVGGKADAVAKAYLAFADSFDVREWIDSVSAATSASESVRLDLMLEISRLGRSATRWILRHHRDLPSVGDFISRYRPRIAELIDDRHRFMSDIQARDWQGAVSDLTAAGVPEPLARRTARAVRLADALPIIDAADQTGAASVEVARVYVELTQTLSVDWLTEQLAALPSTSHWQAMERDALLDDVKTQQGVLAGRVLTDSQGDVPAWLAAQARFSADWRAVIADAQHASVQEFSMYAMTCRKLGDLCRSVH